MIRHTSTSQVLTTAAVRAGWAGVLLFLPVRRRHALVPPAAVTAARVLGLRHLLQATLTVAAPRGPVAGLGAVVDTVHAGSCLALAALSPRWRRVALLDAVVESGFAAAGWRTTLRPSREGRRP
jgi:hypothetical protein